MGDAAFWDGRYRSGSDGWELGRPAPPLAEFLAHHPLTPKPPGRVLVPGCGRGHEARLLADRGFTVVGLDLSSEALAEARRWHGEGHPRLGWCQGDLLDPQQRAGLGLTPSSFQGVVEHTCFCAIDPARRGDYLAAMQELLEPGGWLLGLFWCHGSPGGPPWGGDPGEIAAQLQAADLEPEIWQPAEGSAASRDGSPRTDEWLALWRKPLGEDPPPLTARSLRPPIALSLGGSDSGGGAGIQADLRTFAAYGVHGCTALSCVTAQNTLGVTRVDVLPPEALTAQVAAVVADLPPRALKTGMLPNRSLIEAAAAAIAPLAAFRLIDPVMVSRAGAVLLEPEAISAIVEHLLPLADLITPNRHEAGLLTGLPVEGPADMERAAERLAALLQQRAASLGRQPGAVLIKGGGLAACRGRDLVWDASGPFWLVRRPVDTPPTHGSGCTLGAAITAGIARGLPLSLALRAAKQFVEGGLLHSLAIGGGQGPLCHWHRQGELLS